MPPPLCCNDNIYKTCSLKKKYINLLIVVIMVFRTLDRFFLSELGLRTAVFKSQYSQIIDHPEWDPLFAA
jgi:hypothetical protein